MKTTQMLTFRHAPLVALLGVMLALFSTTTNAQMIPSAPNVEARGYILMDAASGQILVEHNAHEPLPPASLTKIMTDYIVARELHQENLALDDKVTVSVNAWRMGGSKMFIREGTQVDVEDLLRGLVIQSGNDATVALAEHIAGGEDAFAEMMNQQAQTLGMKNSYFVNATGWPDERQVTTAYDMAVLARALIRDFPENYALYREKSFTYNNITQQNRNLLLWRDPSVDGMKTGHTSDAGYCLVSSAERDGMRIVSVVLGASSPKARMDGSQALLNYGFRFFETRLLYRAGEKVAEARTWKGTRERTPLGLAEDLYITVPRGSYDEVQSFLRMPAMLFAPVAQGQPLAELTVSLNGSNLSAVALRALDANPRGSAWQRARDGVLLWFE